MQWQKGRKHQESPSIWERLRGYFQSVGTLSTDGSIGEKMEKDMTLANLSGTGHVKKRVKNNNPAEAKYRHLAITSSHL